jgi:hypothetical protein
MNINGTKTIAMEGISRKTVKLLPAKKIAEANTASVSIK